MAQKIKLDLSQFKASGVYTLEFDASANVILTTQTIRLVVGFSNKDLSTLPYTFLMLLLQSQYLGKLIKI
jgi:hypothetical protein